MPDSVTYTDDIPDDDFEKESQAAYREADRTATHKPEVHDLAIAVWQRMDGFKRTPLGHLLHAATGGSGKGLEAFVNASDDELVDDKNSWKPLAHWCQQWASFKPMDAEDAVEALINVADVHYRKQNLKFSTDWKQSKVYVTAKSSLALVDHFVTDEYNESEPDPQEFTVAEILPHGVCSLIAGDGGAGKSILIQTLATVLAVPDGRIPFLGRAVRPSVSCYINYEDDDDILHMRHHRICRALGIDQREVEGRLILRSMRGEEPDKCWLFKDGKPTKNFQTLEHEIEVLDIGWLGLDSAMFVYADSENDRHPVSLFMRALDGLARWQCGITLAAHTSKSSRADAAHMASGSTAWTNQGRGGLLMDSDDDESTLRLLKPNYAKRGIAMPIEWTDDGVPILKDTQSKVAGIERQRDERFTLGIINERWIGGAQPLLKAGENGIAAFLQRHCGWLKKRAEGCQQRLIDQSLIGPSKRKGDRAYGFMLTTKGEKFLNA